MQTKLKKWEEELKYHLHCGTFLLFTFHRKTKLDLFITCELELASKLEKLPWNF